MFTYNELESFQTFEKAYMEKKESEDVVNVRKTRDCFKLMGKNLRLVYDTLLAARKRADKTYLRMGYENPEDFYDLSMDAFKSNCTCVSLRSKINFFLDSDLDRYQIKTCGGSFLGTQEKLKKIWLDSVGTVKQRLKRSRLSYDITFGYTPTQLYKSGNPKTSYNEVMGALDCTLNVKWIDKHRKDYVEFEYSYIENGTMDNKNAVKKSTLDDAKRARILMCDTSFADHTCKFFMKVCDLDKHYPDAVMEDVIDIGLFIGKNGRRIKAINKFLNRNDAEKRIRVEVNPQIIQCPVVFVSKTSLDDDECNKLGAWIDNVENGVDDLFEGIKK
jgi:hypothetical protein